MKNLGEISENALVIECLNLTNTQQGSRTYNNVQNCRMPRIPNPSLSFSVMFTFLENSEVVY